jgi:ankyrin repeat protein
VGVLLQRGHEPAELLLTHGADMDWVGWDGHTPLDIATQEGHADLAAWLRARGAQPAGALPPESG